MKLEMGEKTALHGLPLKVKNMFRRQVSYRLSKRHAKHSRRRHSQNVEALDLQWSDRQESNIVAISGEFLSSVAKYKSFRAYGRGGDVVERFDDWFHGATAPIRGMRIWTRQYGIDRIVSGIQVLYDKNRWTSVHGLKKGDPTEFILEPGEHIIRAVVRIHNGLKEVCADCSMPQYKKYRFCPRINLKEIPCQEEVDDEGLMSRKKRGSTAETISVVKAQTLTTTVKCPVNKLPLSCSVRFSLAPKYADQTSAEIYSRSYVIPKENLPITDQKLNSKNVQTNICLRARYLDTRKKYTSSSLFHGEMIVSEYGSSGQMACYCPKSFQWTPIMQRAFPQDPPDKQTSTKSYSFEEMFEISTLGKENQEEVKSQWRRHAESPSPDQPTDGTADGSGVLVRMNFTTRQADGNLGMLGPYGGLGCPIKQYMEQGDGTMPHHRLSHISGAVVRAADGRIAIAQIRFHWAFYDHGMSPSDSVH